ncbi:sulfotransferase family protein [Streptomyces sp. TR06-5]|uniref:sulfotransferase family protein n=1 Tax=unclassified Streptomyces TaxID=2593676 RepID=UPI00399F9DC3
MVEIPTEDVHAEQAAEPAPRAAGPPVFVGGCPRSGTTLLRTMLDSHPDLAVPHETQFVVPAWRRRNEFGDLSRADNRRAAARWVLELPKSRFSERIGIPEDELVEAFGEASPTIGSLMATPFVRYAVHAGKPRWGDKRPSYSQNLDALFAMFPDARFVNVVRDPRACVASMGKHWKGWGNLPSAVNIWERTDESVRRAMRRLPSHQITEIRYEDLVADPRAAMERLCAFYDLDPAGIPHMLAYHEGENLPTGAMHENAGKPVTDAPLERWREELNKRAVAFVEHVLAENMEHHGYERSGVKAEPRPQALEKLEAVRKRRAKEDRRRRLVEFSRKFTYRQPVAAVPPQ